MHNESRQHLDDIFESHGRVEELDIDEEFAIHMADPRRQHYKHLVSEKEVRQVHAVAPEYFENEGENRRTPIIMVGPTETGRIVCVPIEPTHARGLWYPVTAFEANTHDKERYEARQGS